MHKKHFTPKEALRRLPLVKKIVDDILEKGQRIQGLLKGRDEDNTPQECYTLQAEIEGLMLELEELGCYYKDWNFKIGLVDFPAMIEGQEVFLCWRSDEPDIRFYHAVSSGYAGRMPIPNHLLN